MIEKLFNQVAVWDEVIPSTSSLTKEQHEFHTLEKVRFSMVTTGRTADSMGYKASNTATLYYLINHSATDGSVGGFPSIKEGEQIEVDGVRLTVASISYFAGLDGKNHHMEVMLR